MKRILIIIFVVLATMLTASAQPSSVKKATKSVLKVTTFTADGTMLSSGYGAFTDTHGNAIAAWTPFKGASKAVVIDAQGKKYDVDCLYGASDIYNMVRMKVKVEGKANITPVVMEPKGQALGAEAWVTGYDVKSPTFTKLSVHSADVFNNDMPYYILEQSNAAIDDSNIGSPVFNNQGQLMGLVNTTKYRTDLHVACARFASTLQPNALSINGNVLRYTSVRVALPSDYNQAVLAMLMASQRNDSINFQQTIEEFITLFPDKEDGYTYKGSYLVARGDFAGADAAMNKAVEVSGKKDNAHYSFAKLIYDKEMYMSDKPYDGWNLDKALMEVEEAINTNPTPFYNVLKGKILYSSKKYNEALDIFNDVNKSDFQDAEVYYYSFLCLNNIDGDKQKQLEMLDSACVKSPNNEMYHTERALMLLKLGRAPECIALCQQIINYNPRYANAHGILGLALCIVNRKETGIAELKRAKALGYERADEFIEKYGK